MRGETARLAGGFAPVLPDQEGSSLPGLPFASSVSDQTSENANGADALKDNLAIPRPRKHGSEKRARTAVLGVRLTAEERAQIDADAERAGLTSGSYARLVLLGARTPRQVRRPPIERKELARLLGELGHIGSNVNQIARMANAGQPVVRSELSKALNGLVEMRNAVLAALGRAR